MRIAMKGKHNGVFKEIRYDLYDEYDPVERLSSMQRTTGYTAASGAELIL